MGREVKTENLKMSGTVMFNAVATNHLWLFQFEWIKIKKKILSLSSYFSNAW